MSLTRQGFAVFLRYENQVFLLLPFNQNTSFVSQVHIVAAKAAFWHISSNFLLNSSDTIMKLTEAGLANHVYWSLTQKTNTSIKGATRNLVFKRYYFA